MKPKLPKQTLQTIAFTCFNDVLKGILKGFAANPPTLGIVLDVRLDASTYTGADVCTAVPSNRSTHLLHLPS